MVITLNIEREYVFAEARKVTDYTGSKNIYNDDKAREKFYATDTDLVTLSRFWDEACETFNEMFKDMHPEVGEGGGDFYVKLEVSNSYDTGLTGTVEKTSGSFFIAFIIAQWFKLAKKDESEEYFAVAQEALSNVERLLYSRKRPSIPLNED